MKDKIHPQYKETTISCACGAIIRTRSTKQNIHVDLCSSCHPFFTGKQKLVDAAGRVERFAQRLAKKKAPGKKGAKARSAKSTSDASAPNEADVPKDEGRLKE